MLGIIKSSSSERNELVQKQPRNETENNLEWLSRAIVAGASPAPALEAAGRKGTAAKQRAKRVAKQQTKAPPARLVLLGGTSPIDFRLRVAQAHVRHDLTPSSWSHVALLDTPASDLGETSIVEVSLEPSGGFGFPPPTNGVQDTKLQRYADPKRYPNIALLTLPVSAAELEPPLAQFRMQRAALDVPELVLAWLAFVWGVGNAGNPLLGGHGIPSAAMLDRILGAAQFDLTPGIVERASCPEAIWQAALWWHAFYTAAGGEAPRGVFCAEHRLDGA